MSVLLVEKHSPQVTLLTLNRPDRRNALTIELMNELTTAIDAAGRDVSQRVLVLRGAGKAFCTGLDLHAAAENDPHQTAQAIAKTLLALAESPLITIAAVHGAAVAGGAGVMSACDFVVAAEKTKFGYPEVRRGLVAGIVMTFLRRQLRERDARELLLASELIAADRALAIGLVNRIVAADQLMPTVEQIVSSILQGAPGALKNSKRLLDELWPTSVRDDIERALKHHLAARESPESSEGIAAFNEKRAPRWTLP